MSEGDGPRELVLDTSVAVKFHVPEVRHEEARRLQRGFENGAVSLLAPGTLLPEVFNAFWQKHRRDELTHDEVRAGWELISELPLSLYAPENLIGRAVGGGGASRRAPRDLQLPVLSLCVGCVRRFR